MFKLLKLSSFSSTPSRNTASDKIASDAGLSGPVERLMRQIDFYMHCELDAEYNHERPEVARRQLIESLQSEFAACNAGQGFGPIGNARHTAPNDPMYA